MKRGVKMRKLAAVSTTLVAASILGLFFGVTQAQAHGVQFTASFPALEFAVARANLIAQFFFQSFKILGFIGPWSAILSLGLGIFLNNALVAVIIAFSSPLILKAKPFSDKYLARIYYEHGIWLFKPIGWTPYRILSLILPIYGLALQCYLIGGIALMTGMRFTGAEFLPFEAISITIICVFASTLALSENPDRDIPKYLRILKKLLPMILLIMFVAAILEAHSILITRNLPS